MTILVTGGTGTLGRLVVPLLRVAGASVRVMSRRPGSSPDTVVGDLDTGAGVDEAVGGAETIVHCAGTNSGDKEKTEMLVRAARRAGAPHLVFISVVGADRVPVVSRFDRMAFGYFESKRGAELAVENSGLPWTTLRATQFYDLVLIALRPLLKLPVLPVPGVKAQPVDAADVARRLVDLALGEPRGLVPDIAGPRVYDATELVRSYLRATGMRRLIVPMPMAGRAAKAVKAGALIAPDCAVAGRTWEEFLTENVSDRGSGRRGSAP